MNTEARRQLVDPVTLSVVTNRLFTVTDEIGERVLHSAQSFVMANARDLGPVLLNEKGQIVMLGDFGMCHTILAEIPTKAMLDKYGGKLDRGDCVLANDGYIIRSGHLPDWNFLVPIYYHDELVFYGFFRAHVADSGGALPSGYFPRAYDCIAEGLNIPPVKIVEKGKECKEIFDLILNNVRNRAAVYADCMLIFGSISKVEEDISQLIDKYGLDTVRGCCEEMIRAGEEAMRREIAKIPDGVYTGESAADWDGTTPDKPVWVRVKLTVKGDEMTFDFSDSQQQVDFINSPLGNTHSHVYGGIFATLDPGIPRNHGAFIPIKIIAPEGTLVNPTYPHTYGACAITCGTQIEESCLQALGKANPEIAFAPFSRHINPGVAGRDPRPEMMIDPRTGNVREYTGGSFAADGGSGAVKGFDGWEGVAWLGAKGTIIRSSLEKFELFNPLYYNCVELLQDSEGPGEFTGCTGTYTELVCDTKEGWPAMCITGNSEGLVTAPHGQAGAPAAPFHEMYIARKGGKEREILRSMDIVSLGPGDVIITKAGGGAGWGNPLDRDMERVKEDVREGVVSVQRAKEVYGVIIDAETLDIDYQAGNRFREES